MTILSRSLSYVYVVERCSGRRYTQPSASHHITSLSLKMNTYYFSSFFISIGKTCFTSFLHIFSSHRIEVDVMWRQKSSHETEYKIEFKIPSHISESASELFIYKYKIYVFLNNQSTCLGRSFSSQKSSWGWLVLCCSSNECFSQLFFNSLSNVIQNGA